MTERFRPLSMREQGLFHPDPTARLPSPALEILQDLLFIWIDDAEPFACVDAVLSLGIETRSSHGKQTLASHLVSADEEATLDFLDYVVQFESSPREGRLDHVTVFVARVADILDMAGSTYQVAFSDGVSPRSWLERRVLPAVSQSISITPSEAANGHLSKALKLAYQHDGNPSEAYREAVKAVEVVAIPVVSPRRDLPTLGSIIGDMRSAPQKWKHQLLGSAHSDPIETVVSMMTTLWKGQTDRHGEPDPRPITEDQARAAVHLAAVLVQWFVSGAITPVAP